MYGYSSFDNYFGINQQQCMMPPNMTGMNQIRPGYIGTLPGINAPKTENKHETGKIIAGLVGAAAALVLLFKGKGKISTVFKKLFGKDAAKVTKKVTDEVAKDASKVTKKATDKVAEDVEKIPFFKKIINKFKKSEKAVASTVKKNADGDSLELTNVKTDIPENIAQVEKDAAEDLSKVKPDIAQDAAKPLNVAEEVVEEATPGLNEAEGAVENLNKSAVRKGWVPERISREDADKINNLNRLSPEAQESKVIDIVNAFPGQTEEQIAAELAKVATPVDMPIDKAVNVALQRNSQELINPDKVRLPGSVWTKLSPDEIHSFSNAKDLSGLEMPSLKSEMSESEAELVVNSIRKWLNEDKP